MISKGKIIKVYSHFLPVQLLLQLIGQVRLHRWALLLAFAWF